MRRFGPIFGAAKDGDVLDGLVFDDDDARKKTPSFLFSLGIGATVDARDALEGGLLVDL